MWLSSKVFELFQVSKDSVSSLREDCAALRAERDTLKHQLAVTQTNFDWLRMKVNSLEVERAGLIEMAYKIKLPVPEIARQSSVMDETALSQFGFDHIDEDTAKKLGIAHLIS